MRDQIIAKKIREAFPPRQAEVLEELFDFLDELVKLYDFNELKGVVAAIAEEQRKFAEAQKRTEKKRFKLLLKSKENLQRLREN